jgi:hypothetical protein
VAFIDVFTPLGQTTSQPVTTLAQPTLSNDSAGVPLETFAPGTHVISAAYSGDAWNLPSFSNAASLQVTLAPSTLSLTPLTPNISYGSPINLVASVTSSSDSGTVTFSDSVSGALAQAPLTFGSANFVVSNLAPGLHTFFATYSGDSLHAGASAASISTIVAQISSSISLAALPASIYAGTQVALSATVSPATASGTVTFRDATLGTLGQSPVSHGSAALTLPNLSAGAYAITAVYSGDANDTSSTSAIIATQITLNPSTASLSATPTTASIGSPVTLMIAMAPASATGTITFFDGYTPLGSGSITAGQATFITSSLAGGTHLLHASYSGDSLNAASASAASIETIAAAASTTSLALAQASVIAGASVTVNVRVNTANTTPSGTVTLSSGATILASGPLASAIPGTAYATLSFSTTGMSLGSVAITASYAGDPNDQPSSSPAASVAILAIPTTSTLTLSSNEISIQSSVTLAASLTSLSGTPTGSITFAANGTTLATAALSNSGTASYTFTPAAIANETLTATYTPGGLFAAALPASATLTVTPPLTFTLNPTSLTGGPGVTTSASLVLTPLSGFAGSIQTTCQTSVTFITCSLSAPQTLSATTTVPVQVSIAWSAAAISLPRKTAVAALLALLLPLFIRRRGARPLRLAALLLTGALSALYLGGCAEGGDFTTVPAGAQTIAVTVTAAEISNTRTLTINIAE